MTENGHRLLHRSESEVNLLMRAFYVAAVLFAVAVIVCLLALDVDHDARGIDSSRLRQRLSVTAGPSTQKELELESAAIDADPGFRSRRHAVVAEESLSLPTKNVAQQIHEIIGRAPRMVGSLDGKNLLAPPRPRRDLERELDDLLWQLGPYGMAAFSPILQPDAIDSQWKLSIRDEVYPQQASFNGALREILFELQHNVASPSQERTIIDRAGHNVLQTDRSGRVFR